ncbi:YHS domain protein [Fulvivirga sp. RKSG066]|uniref:YHS domain-containing (seleno)protein n=1 Tax=Fulvivirga aurantia TaxID=2529383 RepID=UPI0012BCDC38|nr:YHS domain-containing (seleno)protein [Fulvivirga aurantia]MTI20949.1 YHS domain protein [Fulvivirga aurantia]
MKKKLLIVIPSTLVVLLIIVIYFAKSHSISPLSWGAHQPIYKTGEVAINGYDPVAYFKQNKAIEGSPEFSYNWQGADWRFATAKNMEHFKSKPVKYAPQFGGYCAFAVSKGFTSEINPSVYYMQNGKLYLFSNEEVLTEWKENEEVMRASAVENWN